MPNILNIRVTECELDLILDLLHEAGSRTDSNGQPAFELCHDLMEQSGRVVDDLEPTDLEGRTFSVAEDDFINAGMDAREQMKSQTYGEFEVQSTASEAHRPFADTDPRTAQLFKGTATAFVSPANDPIDW